MNRYGAMRTLVMPWHGGFAPCHMPNLKPQPHVLQASSDHHHHYHTGELVGEEGSTLYSSGTRTQQKKKTKAVVPTAESPSRTGSFAIPLQRRRGPGRCAYCETTRKLPCRECGGSGVVDDANEPSSSYHGARMNPVDVNRILHSKWTAMERTCGWRHFHVIQTMNLFVTPEVDTNKTEREKKKKKKKTVYVLLVATCDDQVKLWCPIGMLKCRDMWAAGWLQKSELQSLLQSRQKPVTIPCDTCDGRGTVPCMFCSGNGIIIDLSSSSSSSSSSMLNTC